MGMGVRGGRVFLRMGFLGGTSWFLLASLNYSMWDAHLNKVNPSQQSPPISAKSIHLNKVYPSQKSLPISAKFPCFGASYFLLADASYFLLASIIPSGCCLC